MKIYFAAPLFNPMERGFNEDLVAQIRDLGVDVFLPQENGSLIPDLLSEGMDPDLALETIFRIDIEAIETSEVIIAVLDGRTIDEGVAFELGYAKALGKICIGLQTDFRRMLAIGNNPMISGCLEKSFSEPDAVLAWLREIQIEKQRL